MIVPVDKQSALFLAPLGNLLVARFSIYVAIAGFIDTGRSFKAIKGKSSL